MLKQFDEVRIKATGQIANIVEIDDNGGKSPPLYLVEIRDKTDDMKIEDIIKWLDYYEVEKA